MALFFDQEWFDARLAQAGLTRDNVAAVLHLSRRDIDEIWKDQREMKPDEVRVLAQLLGLPAAEVVVKAGIATPMPSEPPAGAGEAAVLKKLEEMEASLARIEGAVADLQSLILATRNN